MSRKVCTCRPGDYQEKVYEVGGIQFDDSYCGICSLPWRRPKPPNSPTAQRRAQEHTGTSTSAAEAPLREIGRAAFGITYPEDVT